MAEVEDGVEPQRIEIELTPHDPGEQATRSGRGRTESSVDDGATAPPAGVLGTERGRLIAVGAFAATTALLLGVLVGRLGSGDDGEISGAAASTTPSISVATSVDLTTTTVRRPDTLPPAPAIVPVPSVAPRPATTTSTVAWGDVDDPERLVKGSIDIDPAVPVSQVEVVALTDRGELVRIDVPTGTTVSTLLDETGRFGPPALVAGNDAILVQNLDVGQGFTVIHDDGSRAALTTGIGWPLVPNRGQGTFWNIESAPSGGPPERVVEIDVDGVPTGAVIELDGFYPSQIDPRGGVVVQAPGGSYLLSDGSTELLTSGRLLAIGADRAVVQECGESLDCGYFVVDRATGVRTPLDLAPELADPSASIEGGGWWMFSEPVSPLGDAMIAYVWLPSRANEQSLGVIDLVSGDYQEIDQFNETPTTAWSPDGRSVYVLERGQLRVFDRSTGVTTPFAEDLGTVTAFALRPRRRAIVLLAPTAGAAETGDDG